MLCAAVINFIFNSIPLNTKQTLFKRITASFLIAGVFLTAFTAFAQVKIGTNPTVVDPANNLEVESSTTGNKVSVNKTTGKVTIADGSQGTGKILTSDANGEASWQTTGSQNSPVLFNTTNTANQVITSGTNAYVDFNVKGYDRGNNIDLTANTLTIPANGTGVYQFNCIFATLNQAIAQGVYVQIEVNGSSAYSFGIGNCAPGSGIGGGGATVIALNAGDVVRIKLVPSLQPSQSITFFHFNFSGSMVSK